MMDIPTRGEISREEQSLRGSFLNELQREVIRCASGGQTLGRARDRILELEVIGNCSDDTVRQAMTLLLSGYVKGGEFANSFGEHRAMTSDTTSAICRSLEGFLGDEALRADNPREDFVRLQQLTTLLTYPQAEIHRGIYETETVHQVIAGYGEMLNTSSVKKYIAVGGHGYTNEPLFIEIPRAEHALRSSRRSS